MPGLLVLTGGVVNVYDRAAVVHTAEQFAFALASICSVVSLAAVNDVNCGTHPSLHVPRIVMVKRSPGAGVEGLKLMTVLPTDAWGTTVTAWATGLIKIAMKTPDSNLMHFALCKKRASHSYGRVNIE
jgi:hypothetical protein